MGMGVPKAGCSKSPPPDLVDKKLITAEQHSQAQSYILRSDEFCVLNVPSFSTSTVKLAACLWVGVGAYAFSVLDDPTAAFYIWLGHTGSYVLITGQMVKENWDKMKSLRANEEVEIEEMEAAKSFANQLFDYARFFQRRRGPK